MKYLIIDTETTGLDHSAHSVLSIAAQIAEVYPDRVVLGNSFSVLVYDEAAEITQGAANVHGLTKEFLKEHGIPKQEADELFMAFIKQEFPFEQPMIVGHNVAFDLRHLNACSYVAATYFSYRTLDTSSLIRFLSCKTEQYASSSLHRFAEEKGLITAQQMQAYHDALRDCRITASVLDYMLRTFAIATT